MHPSHPSKSYRAREQQQHDINLEKAKIQNAEYDGETAEFGYNQAIFDLLKEPVSLGLVGGNSTRGHQR